MTPKEKTELEYLTIKFPKIAKLIDNLFDRVLSLQKQVDDLSGEKRKQNNMKYRKKPVVIEAFRFSVDYIPDWFMDEVTKNNIVLYGEEYKPLEYCEIKTLEGTMRGEAGDYIIRGVNGEIYPCKPDIFNKTYEVAE